ncbi:MAG: hypothetical protein M3R39_04175 [Actinomycetota bacterium]|nr:hypothetical protein [Actinomycetota bacterium]
MRTSICALAALLTLALTSAAGSRSGPVTLVLAKGPITAFAQDAGLIAWASVEPSNRACPYVVRIRSLVTGRQAAVNDRSGMTCEFARLDRGGGKRPCWPARCNSLTHLALAGHRALWVLTSCGNICDAWFVSGSLATRHDELLRYLGSNSFSRLNGIRGVAGDGHARVYGWLDSAPLEPPDCVPPDCPVVITDYHVDRLLLDPGSLAPVPGAAPPARLAIAGDSVAVLSRGRLGEPPNKQPSEIEVRKLDGALVDRFDVGATVSAIALSAPERVAALVTRSGRKAIEIYDGGTLVAADLVPQSTTAELSISGSRVVFRVGRSIRLLEVGGLVRTLGMAAAKPVGLSIEGKRVAWAEDVRIRGRLLGRVRALVLR